MAAQAPQGEGLLHRLVCTLAGAWLQQRNEGGKQGHSSHCKI